jgi:hypothetical protein
MATSTQDMVRPGECMDLYYYDGETSKKQCWPTTQNTKYVQQFANLTGGSSVFTIPPQMGIQDVVIQMKMPNVNPVVGLALPRGWGYALIKQVSFRYGGSSQYFLTGDQILQNALRRQPSRTTADDVLTLGGQALIGAELSIDNNYANVVLTLPHNIPSGMGKAHPFPTDLLTQQVQITCELNPIASVFSTTGGGSAAPTALDSAQFQVQQVIFNNQGDALARRVDMSVNAYAFPAEFVQQKQTIPLTSQTAVQSVVLTGFRAGEVKAIHCWVSSKDDANGTNNAGGVNPFLWYLPTSVVATYAGDIYARYESGSSALWNLINGDKAPAVDNVLITGGNPPTAAPYLSQWVELPFAQTLLDEDSHYILAHGKPITNGIVNLDIALDATTAALNNLVLNVSYIYNTTLLFSQGTCDYVF